LHSHTTNRSENSKTSKTNFSSLTPLFSTGLVGGWCRAGGSPHGRPGAEVGVRDLLPGDVVRQLPLVGLTHGLGEMQVNMD
jgi:hypothetical protein